VSLRDLQDLNVREQTQGDLARHRSTQLDLSQRGSDVYDANEQAYTDPTNRSPMNRGRSRSGAQDRHAAQGKHAAHATVAAGSSSMAAAVQAFESQANRSRRRRSPSLTAAAPRQLPEQYSESQLPEQYSESTKQYPREQQSKRQVEGHRSVERTERQSGRPDRTELLYSQPFTPVTPDTPIWAPWAPAAHEAGVSRRERPAPAQLTSPRVVSSGVSPRSDPARSNRESRAQASVVLPLAPRTPLKPPVSPTSTSTQHSPTRRTFTGNVVTTLPTQPHHRGLEHNAAATQPKEQHASSSARQCSAAKHDQGRGHDRPTVTARPRVARRKRDSSVRSGAARTTPQQSGNNQRRCTRGHHLRGAVHLLRA
jgi:hypothetical protein